MRKRWIIAPVMDDCQQFAGRINAHPLIAQLLHNRGIRDENEARLFLSPQLKALYPPEQLPGATQAAALIADKIRDKKKIAIYGDYDVDGITATAILWHLLQLTGSEVSYYIPHRLEEGYGLNADALRQLHNEGVDTVITVDCGATAVEEAQLARQLGLTLIITDHHTLGDPLPDADAIVHPRLDNTYPNPDLCGAGVAFKLAWAIAQNLSRAERVSPEFRDFLLDATALAALGTVADVSSLLGENRIITRFGLVGLAESKRDGLRALIESAKLTDTRLNSEHAGFWLAPRLNAAGRMGHAQLAVELFTTADLPRAEEIALYLTEQNRQRQNLERRIFKEACTQVEEHRYAGDARRGIVLAHQDWHAGVIGIVASRIVEKYHRPTVMIALTNGQGQGSARSVRHFQLHQALSECAEHLIGFGGHAMAAGLRISSDRVEDFRDAFVARANSALTGRDLQPTLDIDAQVALDTLSEPLVRQIDLLGPFGNGNPKPRLASDWLHLDGEPRLVGKNGDHLSFRLNDGQRSIKAIAFRRKDDLQPLLDHRRCRVAFAPVLNHFNGRTSVEMQVQDIEYPDS